MKRKKQVLTCTVAITLVATGGFVLNGFQLSRLTAQTKTDINKEIAEMQTQEELLKELTDELNKMDTPEYIKKVAQEQLGMVEEDTIVFREKK